MKATATVLALVAAIALPAVSDAASKKKPRHRPAEAVVSQGIGSVYYQGGTQYRQRSPRREWDVYRPNGDYAGSDPDPFIRSMLRRDDLLSDP